VLWRNYIIYVTTLHILSPDMGVYAWAGKGRHKSNEYITKTVLGARAASLQRIVNYQVKEASIVGV